MSTTAGTAITSGKKVPTPAEYRAKAEFIIKWTRLALIVLGVITVALVKHLAVVTDTWLGLISGTIIGLIRRLLDFVAESYRDKADLIETKAALIEAEEEIDELKEEVWTLKWNF